MKKLEKFNSTLKTWLTPFSLEPMKKKILNTFLEIFSPLSSIQRPWGETMSAYPIISFLLIYLLQVFCSEEVCGNPPTQFRKQ